MVDFTCKFPFRVFKKYSFQIWLPNDPLDLKIYILVFVFQSMMFRFVHFEYKNNFWHIAEKFVL